MTQQYLTVEAAAASLHLHPETIRRACRHGHLAHSRIGRRLIRITPDALARWLEKGAKTAPPRRG